ncbi:MAG: hypothetical protein EOM12_16640 [Verrucomicrobiae bacterium]|nr:hypothetical protein [Verrucomicrobiae bacterium]
MKYRNKALQAARILNNEDVNSCLEAYRTDTSSQIFRRNLICAQFAFVEAGLYGLRYMAALGEETKIPKKTPAKQNLEDSFNGLAATLDVPLAVSKQNTGWDAMTKAIRMRDRITHPRKPEELLISDSDMKIFDRATKWFSDTMVELKSVIERMENT